MPEAQSFLDTLCAAYPAVCTIDLETRNRADDLTVVGGYRYAEHVELVCAVTVTYTADTEVCDRDIPVFDLDMHLNELPPDSLLVAHNMDGFEHPVLSRLIRGGVYTFDLLDSATICRMHGVPASLDKAARFLGLGEGKLESGKALIKRWLTPTFQGEIPAKVIAQLTTYCERDTWLIGAILDRLPSMHPDKLHSFMIEANAHRYTNDRGVRVDTEYVEAALDVVDAQREAINRFIARRTEGWVSAYTQLPKLKAWLAAQGHPVTSLDKAARTALLPTLAGDARGVVSLVHGASKSSLSKLEAIVDQTSSDGILRGSYVHAGAGQTLRFASRGVQIHNLPRKTVPSDEFLELREKIIDLIPDSFDTLSQSLRQTLVPREGQVFVIADWSNIEARKLPWLADSAAALVRLDIYRDPSRDVYLETAKDIGFEGNRQIGKVAELALGYGGGAGALQSMAANFGVTIDDKDAGNIVRRWRKANGWAVDFWDDCLEAALKAVGDPGWGYHAGRVTYLFDSELDNLMALLPTGDTLYYPKAAKRAGKVEYSVASRYSVTKGHTVKALWRGLAAENVTQASAAALLRAVLRATDLDVVLHTHDEIVVQCLPEHVDKVTKGLTRSMTTDLVDLAPGLPLDVEVSVRDRYEK